MKELGITAMVLWVFLGGLLQINVVLMLFNLLPIPPLDGATVLRGIIPYKHLETFDFIITHPYYVVPAFIAIIFLGARPISAAINFVTGLILAVFGMGGLV